MESQVRQCYPIGRQDFSGLIEDNCIYVDKTDFVYKITHEESKYLLLTRARRFGKSLMVSTLKAYFEARRDLFKGLKIEALEKDWTKYAVILLDLSGITHLDNKEDIYHQLNFEIYFRQDTYDVEKNYDLSPCDNLKNLIKRLYNETGKQVVVLIDEYDSPLSHSFYDKDADLELVKKIIGEFFQTLNDLEPYIKFVFFTGIMNLSKTEIFSNFTNLKDISFDSEYANIVGFTKEELLSYFKIGIEEFAREKEISFSQMVEQIESEYNGYHFCYPSPDIYNPWCLLNVLDDKDLRDYWFDTGSPILLIDTLKKFNYSAIDISKNYVKKEAFNSSILSMQTPLPLFYQTGYLTIKGYDSKKDEYLLVYPNHEIYIRFLQSLLPSYIAQYKYHIASNLISDLYTYFKEGLLQDALVGLQSSLIYITRKDPIDKEQYLKNLLYIIFSILDRYKLVDIEILTFSKRLEVVLKINFNLYLLGLNFDFSKAIELEQININKFSEKFAHYNLPIIKVGINFTKEETVIYDWVIEK